MKIKSNINPVTPGQVYAVTKGTLLGSNLVIVKENSTTYSCLNLPDMENIDIIKDDMTTGLENEILELLETLPSDIMSICTKQHEKNINN